MPLSEHEQRQLEQIEQALSADHPRLARTMRAKDPKVHYRRKVLHAAIAFLAGIGLVAAGLLLKYHWIAAIGVLAMVVSCVWAVSSYRRMASSVARERRRRQDRRGPDRRWPKPPPSNGLMERIEERWRRRQEGNNR
ncbi:MAG TPA: DUF3040 domain-containing protein [Streptosporangiaceae bacterium]